MLYLEWVSGFRVRADARPGMTVSVLRSLDTRKKNAALRRRFVF
jgi:hypothetical protein